MRELATHSGRDWIPQGKVTSEHLLEVFRPACDDAAVDEDGDLQLQFDGGRVFVEVISSPRFIRYSKYLRFQPDSELVERYRLVARMNMNMVMPRFMVAEDNPEMLVVDYLICYEGGVSPSQLVHLVGVFSHVVRVAILNFDEKEIVL